MSATKVHDHEPSYQRERDVYRWLRDQEVTDVRGCNVPRLVASDDSLWVIEMSIVARPFVLDFAGAYLGRPPDFSEEVLADWEADKREQFGSRWPEVRLILGALEGLGVFMEDVNPGNIALGD